MGVAGVESGDGVRVVPWYNVLRPGHAIAYFSPIYANFDKRGLRTGVIERIDQDGCFDYPVRVSTREILPRYTYLRRIVDDAGGSLTVQDTGWSQLRVCRLIDGEYEDLPRRESLTAALRKAVEASFEAVRTRLRREALENEEGIGEKLPDGDSGVKEQTVKANSELTTDTTAVSCGATETEPAAASCGTTEIEAASASSGATENEAETAAASSGATENEVVDPDKLVQFESLLTPAQRRKRKRRGRDRLGLQKITRKRRFSFLKATSRDSQHVYRARSTQSHFLKEYMRLPHVKKALRARRAASSDLATAVTCVSEGEVTNTDQAHDKANAESEEYVAKQVCCNEPDTTPKCPIPWPTGPGSAKRVKRFSNPFKVSFKDAGGLGLCKCSEKCYLESCLNSTSETYCTRSNCAVKGGCSNSLAECHSLALFDTGSRGLGVFTSESIEVGVIIAEYLGVLDPYEGMTEANEHAMPKKNNSGYSLLLNELDLAGRFVYIEAEKKGTLARYVNHSCNSNCRFREMKTRNRPTAVLVSVRPILKNEEITVQYSGNLWFTCTCGSHNCVDKDKPLQEEK